MRLVCETCNGDKFHAYTRDTEFRLICANAKCEQKNEFSIKS